MLNSIVMMAATTAISSPTTPPNAIPSSALSHFDIATILSVVGALVLICGAGGLFLRARKYIEDRVSDALAKEEVIRRISLLVKPDLVFDHQESILSDRGARALLGRGGISVTLGEVFGTRRLPVKIQIDFSRHLPVAPLLTPLNPDVVSYTTKPGKDCEWIYMLTYTMAGDYDAQHVHRYRLEIL